MRDTYIRKGKRYSVQRELKFKNPISGEWVAAIHYVDTKTSEHYVRTKEDFLKKFELFEDNKEQMEFPLGI